MQSRERGFLSVSKEASWHQNVFYFNRGSQMGHFHLLPLFLSGLFVYLRNFHVLHVLLVPSHPWNQFKQKTQKSEIYRKSQIGWIAQQFTCGKWSGKWDFVSSSTTSRNKVIFNYRVEVVKIPTLDLFVTAQVLEVIGWPGRLLILMLRDLDDPRIRPVWYPVNFKLLILIIPCASGMYFMP